jgi:hypothetical protein
MVIHAAHSFVLILTKNTAYHQFCIATFAKPQLNSLFQLPSIQEAQRVPA